ncbi:MAG: universal stress protein [Bacteroidales bacterium]
MEERLVTLTTTHYTAAEVLKARLESAGIECYLKHVRLIQGDPSEGVQVQIRSSDVIKALELMTEWKKLQEDLEQKNIKSIRRILVPVDFSEFSKNACLYALDLAYRLKADLKIFHVYYAPIIDLVPITDAYSIQVDMDINLREMEMATRKQLVEFVNEIREIAQQRGLEKVKVGYSLREGIVEDEISHMAKSYKPGLIVMGAKGKGEKQSDIIGSVVYKVLDRSRVPVLAIPQHSRYDASTEVKNVVYATDFDDSDYVAIRRLMSIVSEFPVKIYCVHISRETGKVIDSMRMKSLKEYFHRINPGIAVECILVEGEDTLKKLEEFTAEHKIDLISLVNKKRGLLSRLFKSGITKKLISQSTTPLLIFRA